jgi:hypothetical protein
MIITASKLELFLSVLSLMHSYLGYGRAQKGVKNPNLTSLYSLDFYDFLFRVVWIFLSSSFSFKSNVNLFLFDFNYIHLCNYKIYAKLALTLVHIKRLHKRLEIKELEGDYRIDTFFVSCSADFLLLLSCLWYYRQRREFIRGNAIELSIVKAIKAFTIFLFI